MKKIPENNNEKNVFLDRGHNEWRKDIETKIKTGDIILLGRGKYFTIVIGNEEMPEKFMGMKEYPIHTVVANEDGTATPSAHKIKADEIEDFYYLFSRYCGTLTREESEAYLSRINKSLEI